MACENCTVTWTVAEEMIMILRLCKSLSVQEYPQQLKKWKITCCTETAETCNTIGINKFMSHTVRLKGLSLWQDKRHLLCMLTKLLNHLIWQISDNFQPCTEVFC